MAENHPLPLEKNVRSCQDVRKAGFDGTNEDSSDASGFSMITNSHMNSIKLFTGRAHPALAKNICEYLGLPLSRAIVGNFPDGEISCKIDEDVRGRDVFIVQPTCPPVNENLMELLIMIESLKRASADRITAVIPYFG